MARSPNRLLAALAPPTRRTLLAAGRRLELTPGQALLHGGEQIRHLVFPETAMVALSVRTGAGLQEVGVIGGDGVVGWARMLGGAPSGFDARVAVRGGTAISVPAAALDAAAAEDPALTVAILGFAQRLMVQMARTLCVSMRDTPVRRIARLLLMLDDRMAEDALPVTHAAIAASLNLRRATVTDCLHILEGERLVRCSRGSIAVRDRPALEVRAADAYGIGDALAPVPPPVPLPA